MLDALYRPHELTHSTSAFGKAPAGPLCEYLPKEALPHVASFASKFEAGIGKPLCLQNASASAIASGAWKPEAMCERIGERVLHAGGVNLCMRGYPEYASTNTDD